MINTDKLVWHNPDKYQHQYISKDVKSWLYDEQSLTKKLKCKFKLFSVNVIAQKKISPSIDESKVLAHSGACIERRVELLGNDNALVYARSVIPETIDTINLLNIGTKPLGEVLFNSRNISREIFQITNVKQIWGRRSIFTVGNTKILVSEFFLDALFL